MTTDRSTITILLRPDARCSARAVLRALLKRALRDYGLRAVKIKIEQPKEPEA